VTERFGNRPPPRKGLYSVSLCRALQSRVALPEVKSLFAREKEALHAMRGPARHPRHGGTFMSVNPNRPSHVSIMRNAPTMQALPSLPSQKPKTKLMVSLLLSLDFPLDPRQSFLLFFFRIPILNWIRFGLIDWVLQLEKQQPNGLHGMR